MWIHAFSKGISTKWNANCLIQNEKLGSNQSALQSKKKNCSKMAEQKSMMDDGKIDMMSFEDEVKVNTAQYLAVMIL